MFLKVSLANWECTSQAKSSKETRDHKLVHVLLYILLDLDTAYGLIILYWVWGEGKGEGAGKREAPLETSGTHLCTWTTVQPRSIIWTPLAISEIIVVRISKSSDNWNGNKMIRLRFRLVPVAIVLAWVLSKLDYSYTRWLHMRSICACANVATWTLLYFDLIISSCIEFG